MGQIVSRWIEPKGNRCGIHQCVPTRIAEKSLKSPAEPANSCPTCPIEVSEAKTGNSRLGRALEIDERARRSTDSRGPEAEIDHLGSFQAQI